MQLDNETSEQILHKPSILINHNKTRLTDYTLASLLGMPADRMAA